MYSVRDRVLRFQKQSGGDVPKLKVQVNDDHTHGSYFPQTDGQVGGNRGFADPSFGRHHGYDAAAVLVGLRGRGHSPTPARRREAGSLKEDAEIVDPNLGG